MTDVLGIWTHKSNSILLAQGGTKSWKLDPGRARNCAFVVICRLNRAQDPSSYNQPHRAAVLVAEIQDVVPVDEEPGRWNVTFGRYAEVLVPDVFPVQRSPITYLDTQALLAKGLDLTALDLQPLPPPAPLAAAPAGRLAIDEAVIAVANIMGCRPSQVRITISA